MQKDSEHKSWWKARRGELLENLAAAHELLDGARREITALKKSVQEVVASTAGAITANPGHPVHAHLETQRVLEERDQKQAAYRQRDRALLTIWDLQQLHHEKDSRTCSCGSLLNACREFRALIPIDEVAVKWERNQIERMRDGKEHGLSRDHPDASRGGTLDWKGQYDLHDRIEYVGRWFSR